MTSDAFSLSLFDPSVAYEMKSVTRQKTECVGHPKVEDP